jgi:hypothetical protein
MAKKKRQIPTEVKARWAETMRLLEERIAFHERKAAEQRAAADAPSQT